MRPYLKKDIWLKYMVVFKIYTCIYKWEKGMFKYKTMFNYRIIKVLWYLIIVKENINFVKLIKFKISFIDIPGSHKNMPTR